MNKLLNNLLALALLFSFIPVSHALTNGGVTSGFISVPDETDSYTFNAAAGDSIRLSLSGSITMWMQVYEPGGALLANSQSAIAKDSLVSGGTYTVLVSANSATETGDYDLHYARAPGGNEHGALSDHDLRTGDITRGDLDSYTLTVDAGDSIRLNVSGSITMWMVLYAPDGSRIGNSQSTIAQDSLAQAGTYTVVISSYTAHQTGDYDLHYARAPGGNEHGALSNHDLRTGNITRGDLDSYTLTADAGDSIRLNVSGSITMWMVLYAPDGSRISHSQSTIAQDSLVQAGTYTVVISSYTAHQTGDYDLHYARAPGGNEHGALSDHDLRTGNITRGDLDSYTLTVDAGDSIRLNVSGSITMWMVLYAPDGSRIGNSQSTIAQDSLVQAGTYTVVISSNTAHQTGDYDLHYARVPGGNEHGALSDHDLRTGNITRGDLDSYTLMVDAGDSIRLNVSGSITMWMVLYAPDGSRIGNSQSTIAQDSLVQAGTYTVVISSYTAHQTGDYDLHYARAPGANEHGKISSGDVLSEGITRGDLDSYTLTVATGDSIQLNVSGSITMWMVLYAPDGSRISHSQSAIALNSLAQAGTYTVVISSYTAHQTGNYQLAFYSTGTGQSEAAKEACNEDTICGGLNYVGNPINTAQGFKAQPEADYRNGRLEFVRIYRSDSNWTNRDLGEYWRHTYYRDINFFLNGSVLTAEVTDGRGAVVAFTQSGSTWQQVDPDYQARFENIYNTGLLTGYRFITPGDTREVYDTNAKLVRIEYRGGVSLDFGYDASSRLANVTDEEGHVLVFTYNTSDRIQNMTTPDGVFGYSYDGNNNLVQVTRPDTTTRTYHYEDAGYINALTGITNEENIRITTWGYDAQGRAVLSEQAGGLNRYTVVYNPDESVTVSNPLGKQTSYQFQTIHGVRKITAIDNHASPNSSATSETNTYTTEGWLDTETDAEGNVTRYTYDSRGLEISRIEADGTPEVRTITTTWDTTYRVPDIVTEPSRTTDYDYDAFGRVTAVTVTDTATTASRTTTNIYHPNTVNGNGDIVLGRLAAIDGPRTNVSDVTSYDYDANFNLIRITNGQGHEVNITSFDTSGRPLSITDENGIATTNVYDTLGRLTSQTRGTRTTSYSYDDAGQLVLVTLPDGRFYTYGYDNAQRLISIQSASGERTEYVLDNAGNRLEEIMRHASGIVTSRDRQEFDELNRLLASIDTINSTDARTEFSYDDNGNLKTITDPYTSTSTYLYDALQRVTAFIDAATGVTGSAYNPLDQLALVTAPNNAQTQFTYNAFGDVILEVSPDRGATNYTYDNAGNLSTKTDARSITATYTYDTLNRLTLISYPNSAEDISYFYDTNPGGAIACSNGIGQLCRVTDESGVTHFAYDIYGNITQRVHTELGVDYTHQFAYDQGDNLIQLTGSDTRVIAYSRDTERRISQVDADINGVPTILASNISYNPDGQETTITFGNGLTENRSYDENGLLQNQTQTVLVLGDVAPVALPDGLVNTADLLVMMRLALGLLTPTVEQLQNGDIYPPGSPDGIINIQDALLLQKMVLQ